MNKGRQLRGAFTGEGPIEEADGTVKFKLGAGRLGTGPPMQVHHNGAFKPITDGSGLCSAGRWHPEKRRTDIIADRIDQGLWTRLVAVVPDPLLLLYQLAKGNCTTSPFSEALLQEGRQAVMEVLRLDPEGWGPGGCRINPSSSTFCR